MKGSIWEGPETVCSCQWAPQLCGEMSSVINVIERSRWKGIPFDQLLTPAHHLTWSTTASCRGTTVDMFPDFGSYNLRSWIWSGSILHLDRSTTSTKLTMSPSALSQVKAFWKPSRMDDMTSVRASILAGEGMTITHLSSRMTPRNNISWDGIKLDFL